MTSTDPHAESPPAPAPATASETNTAAGHTGLGTKLWVGFVSALVLFFAVMAGRAAVIFLQTGSFLAVVIGVSVLLVVGVGLVVLGREVLFGLQTERLGRLLTAEGGLPEDDLPRSPGGRIDRAAADEQFERYRAEAEAAPQDWRTRYRLSLAYDASGDRTRARAAAREAVRLHRAA